jgi:alkanesulfonate monooxygenase SsuD/methylene tetrahydromethanopterin reductase-like flavin-dependent oxidoreductase (luciferase family)
VEFGLFYESDALRPWDENSHKNAFWEAVEQIKLAESVGFEYVWEVEHHFLGEFSISTTRCQNSSRWTVTA